MNVFSYSPCYDDSAPVLLLGQCDSCWQEQLSIGSHVSSVAGRRALCVFNSAHVTPQSRDLNQIQSTLCTFIHHVRSLMWILMRFRFSIIWEIPLLAK
jgi:hypothetical protein